MRGQAVVLGLGLETAIGDAWQGFAEESWNSSIRSQDMRLEDWQEENPRMTFGGSSISVAKPFPTTSHAISWESGIHWIW